MVTFRVNSMVSTPSSMNSPNSRSGVFRSSNPKSKFPMKNYNLEEKEGGGGTSSPQIQS